MERAGRREERWGVRVVVEAGRGRNGRIGRPSRIDRQDLLIKLDFPTVDLLRPRPSSIPGN